MSIPDHELPGWLVSIIFVLVILCLILALAFLGYLPSPLSSKLEAHDKRGERMERANLITCGLLMESVRKRPELALRCFDDDDPKSIFVGTR